MRVLRRAAHLAVHLVVASMLVPAVAEETPHDLLCAVCPDPTRDIGPDNLPSKEKTGAYMWVSTMEGIELVRDSDWSGDVSEYVCKWCPDPFRNLAWDNLPVVRNHHEFRVTRMIRDDGSRLLKVEKNPNWNGERSSDNEENSEEENGLVTDPVDRSKSQYHVMGQDIFQHELLNSIGGVLSQGILEAKSGGLGATVELVLGLDGEYPGHIWVNSPSLSGPYRIRYEELVPMVLFVDSGGTSLFTLWSADDLPDNFAEEAGFVETAHGSGHVAIEFSGTHFEDALIFLDLCGACVMFPESVLEEAVVNHLTTATESTEERSSSYINTDVATFRLVDRSSGHVAVSGAVSRFYWSSTDEQKISVVRVLPILRPEDMRPNANRILDILLKNRELENRHILQLMRGIDVTRSLREEASLKARRRLADAFYLFETLALLRGTKRNAPDQWSAFVATLRSNWLMAQHIDPWERFTKTRCQVFPGHVICN